MSAADQPHRHYDGAVRMSLFELHPSYIDQRQQCLNCGRSFWRDTDMPDIFGRPAEVVCSTKCCEEYLRKTGGAHE